MAENKETVEIEGAVTELKEQGSELRGSRGCSRTDRARIDGGI
jgi:hypothetical protein